MLVDSSVWISAAKSGTPESKKLKALLLDQSVEIFSSKIIQLEVSQGARTNEQFTVLWEGFENLRLLSIEDTHWKQSAINFFKCRKKGITISTIDCLIATLAQQYNRSLWSLDKVFKQVAPVLGIEVINNSNTKTSTSQHP